MVLQEEVFYMLHLVEQVKQFMFMTTNDYITNIKVKYPNTYIGLTAYHKGINSSLSDFMFVYVKVPLDYCLSLIINYIEYREVNFLEALCNLQVDYPNDNHQMLRLKTVTNILHRLERFITPAEGQPF
jgi:hypothetical protein